MSERSEGFGAAVAELLARHGISQNMASIRTGIDRFTVSRMVAGIAPRLDIIEKWAKGFGEDVNRWRVLAGYDAVEPEWNADSAFMEGVQSLAEEFREEFTVSAEELFLARQTPAEVEAALAAIRKRFEERRRQRCRKAT